MIDKIVHFDFNKKELCVNGYAHFGFHTKDGAYFGIDHGNHYLGLINQVGEVEWTLGAEQPFSDIPNIEAQLQYPMYVDQLDKENYIVSNIGNKYIYRFNSEEMKADVLINGKSLGMKDMGNCVVDDKGCIWVNEVEGCRIWRFDASGEKLYTLGSGKPGFDPYSVPFNETRFNWIYDIRKGPDGNIYVLDSKNYAVRMIDLADEKVHTIAGIGSGGYLGDGGEAKYAVFGSDPEKYFDGPFSLSVDEDCNIYVGDRYNHVLRMIDGMTGIISTVAGDPNLVDGVNDSGIIDPLKLYLPMISSMDYHKGRIYLPTDLPNNQGDLILLKKKINAQTLCYNAGNSNALLHETVSA